MKGQRERDGERGGERESLCRGEEIEGERVHRGRDRERERELGQGEREAVGLGQERKPALFDI